MAAIIPTLSFSGGKTVTVPASPVVPIEAQSQEFEPYYAGAGISWFTIEDKTSKEEFSSKNYLLFAGVNLTEIFGGEIRYQRSFGKMEYDHGNTQNSDYNDYPGHFTNYGAYLKMRYWIDGFTPYILLGYGRSQFDGMPNTSGRAKRTETGFQWGGGATYSIYKDISIFAEYMQLYSGKGFDGRAVDATVNIDNMNIGFSYKF